MNQYTRLTQNMVKHLKKGEEVSFNGLLVKIVEDKLVVNFKRDKQETELFYRLESGNYFGLSKEQLKDIFSQKEKPIFSTSKR